MSMQKSPSDSELTFQHDTKEYYAAAGIVFQKRYKVKLHIPAGWSEKITPRNFAKTLLVLTNVNILQPAGLVFSMEKDYKLWAFSA